MRIFCSNEVIPSSPVSFPNGLPYCLAFQDLSDLQERSLPNRGWNIVIPEGAWKIAILVGCGGTQACQPYLHSRRRQRCEVGLIYPVSFGPARATSETLSQKRWKGLEKGKKERALLCSARALHSASAVSLWHRIRLPSLEQPGYSSNQIFLSPSCFLTLTLPIHKPWLQAYNPFIFFKLKPEYWNFPNVGLSQDHREKAHLPLGVPCKTQHRWSL